MNARKLFDDGATIGEVAAELEIPYTLAAYMCEPLAPQWPTLSPEVFARLPENLQRQVIANNPNHRNQKP